MIDSTDQMGMRIRLENFPQRIVSLVPSQTELLHDLGLEAEVVGITKFCIHPEKWFVSKTRIGGTKSLHIDKIFSLNPDLIIGNKEENDASQINVMKSKFPVWMSDIHSLTEALKMILEIGELTGKKNNALELTQKIRSEFLWFTSNDVVKNRMRTSYIIWKNPYMVAAGDTFINDMIGTCGLINIFGNRNRYPVITLSELQECDPELILLSTEPFPFSQADAAELKLKCPKSRIVFANGEYFSWYGSRLLKSPEYFKSLLSSINSAS